MYVYHSFNICSHRTCALYLILRNPTTTIFSYCKYLYPVYPQSVNREWIRRCNLMNVYKLLGGLFGDRISYRKECDQTYHNKYTVIYNMPLSTEPWYIWRESYLFFLMSFFISNQARSINFEKKEFLGILGKGWGFTLPKKCWRKFVPFLDYM